MKEEINVKERSEFNSKSILALGLGLLSIFISIIIALGFIIGIIGIVIGFIGLREIKMTNQSGKNLTIIGILSCVIGTFLPVLFMI